MLALFRNRLFFALASGHFVVDVLNSIVPVLLAVLATSQHLTNAQIGLALTLFTFGGSLSQPLFGWLADRFPGRPSLLAGGGAIWMALWFLGVTVAQSWWLLLACLLIGVLGSGLFHPIGASSAAAAHPARAGSATALFFFCGQVGLALGPLIAGLLFRSSGALGVLPLSLVALLPAGLLLAAPAAPACAIAAQRGQRTVAHAAFMATTAFVVLVAVRSSIQAAYSAFLPKLFADRGWDPAAYGALAGTFMLAAAIGNVVTGELADRQGMRAATVWPLLLSVPAGLVCLWAPTPAAAFVACALAGLLIGGQHSVLVVHAQRLLPTRQGFAAGLILGFTFAAGGLGVWIGGLLADQVGLLPVMQAITLLGVPAAFLALTLPGRVSVIPSAEIGQVAAS
ncbi:MAG TPA: MFS transporter [Roseiflexaceae bacterium]|nr:MFS transporter [Roseiflexaceae bacterium]